LEEGLQNLPLDHQWAAIIYGSQAGLEPAPHGIAVGAEQARHLFHRVGPMQFR
jgi:hypothetical protein